MFSLRPILCHLGVIFTAGVTAAQPAPRLYINYSAKPPPGDLLHYDLCLLDPYSKADLKPGQEKGNRFLAYVSLVELAKGSPSEAEAKLHNVPFLAVNEDWASRLMDVTTMAWRQFVEANAEAIFAKGFDGVFLDTADSVANPVFKDKAHARSAVINMIRALHKRWPAKRIVLNRGFDLLTDVAPCLSGVLVESVYQSFDPATKAWRAVPTDGSRWVEAKIKAAKALHLPVYAVDYVNPAEPALAKATADRLRALGCIALVTTPALNGVVLVP